MVKPFVVWVVSCLIFIVFVSSSNVIPYTKTEASIRNVFLLVLFFVGILSYFIFLHRYSKRYGDFHTVAMAIFLVIASFFSLLTISNSSFFKYKQTEKKPDNTKVANFNLINPGITVGVTGEDVKIIQSALKTDPSLYPSGTISGYYGNLTKEAVINFQRKYSITESGTMDNRTTEKFNEVYGNQTRSYYLNLYPTNIPAPIYVDKQVNTTNTDPIIDCVSSYPNCNGSSIKAPKSQCSRITCCQIGSSWSVYATDEQCDEAQKNTQQQTFPQNTTKIQGNNVYCWNNAYGYGYYTSSGDQCNLDNAKLGTYKICMDTQKMKSDSCNSSCKNTSDHDNGVCAWAYTGANPGIELSTSKYGECLNGTGGTAENYTICLGKCSDQYAQDIKQCGN